MGTGVSADGFVRTLLEEAALLRAEVESGPRDPGSQDRIRDKLLELGREIDSRIHELQEIRESLRPVAARYRALYREPAAPPRRFDHLGAAAHRERGWSALAAGAFADAVAALRHALELDPHDRRTAAMLAWAFAGAGDPDRAAAILVDTTATDEPDSLERMALGYLELVRGRCEEGTRHLAAVAREGSDPTAVLYAHLYLGIGYAQQGMPREAQRCLRRALEIGPNLTEGYWELGRCHLQEGRADLAIEAWRIGGENRFSAWGERCRDAALKLEEGRFGDSA